MALRSLDNALPSALERPKKVAKLSTLQHSVPKPSDPSVNDENKVPIPAADATIDYVSSEDLKPLGDPEIQIKSLMEGLESKDWVKVCESLNTVRRFALYHSAILLPTLEKVMLVMVKCMKNPRSALCKTSIMAASDIFKSYGDQLLQSSEEAFNQLVLQLLLKASQDKRFVCEEAENSLVVMVGSIPCLPLLNTLRAFVKHTSPKVRAKAAVSFAHSVTRSGLGVMKEFGMVALVQIAADLLNDRLPEAREAARSTVTCIYDAFTRDLDLDLENSQVTLVEAWQDFCCSHLSPIQAQSLIKIVSN